MQRLEATKGGLGLRRFRRVGLLSEQPQGVSPGGGEVLDGHHTESDSEAAVLRYLQSTVRQEITEDHPCAALLSYHSGAAPLGLPTELEEQ